MRTVSFQSVLNGLAAKLGMDPLRDLNPARAASLTEYINLRLSEGWKWEFWPEWTVTEQRAYARAWATGQAPQAGEFRYLPATQKYYQCLGACGDVPPASLDANGAYQVNVEFWIEAAPAYSGADYNAATAYALGAVVRNPGDGNFYARAIALQVTGAGSGAVNQDWLVTGLVNNFPLFGPLADYRIQADGVGDWGFFKPTGELMYVGGPVAGGPDQVTAWSVFPDGTAPGPVFTDAFTVPDPSDADYWSQLIPFAKIINYTQLGQTAIGEVKLVSRKDPRVWPDRPGKINFAPGADGIQILDCTAPAVVWLTFRLPPPQFTSVLYSAISNVAAKELRYWPTASGGTGEVYQALQAQTPAAQNPANAAYWSKVSFPEILANFVKRAAFADTLSDQKQQDRKTNELETAMDELADASDRALAGQGQFDGATVQTYGG